MNKRRFLKNTLLASAGLSIAPSILMSAQGVGSEKPNKWMSPIPDTLPGKDFELPKLSYSYDAFPDTIDAQTMEIHYSKHFQGYTNNLNTALKSADISDKTIEEILQMENLPDAIRNNGGGYYNHSLYFEALTPGGSLSESLKAKITSDFGSFEALLNQLADSGAKRFGSGWTWLCQDSNKKLFVASTPNQDNPLMKVSGISGNPVLGIDVWEHAYYLKYQNKRGDYLQNILKIINWDKVESKLK